MLLSPALSHCGTKNLPLAANSRLERKEIVKLSYCWKAFCQMLVLTHVSHQSWYQSRLGCGDCPFCLGQ